LRRNSLLKHVIERKKDGRKKLREDEEEDVCSYLKEKIEYWKLKEEALDRTLRRTRFGRGHGPVVRHTKQW
jgi:hypothetical protein